VPHFSLLTLGDLQCSPVFKLGPRFPFRPTGSHDTCPALTLSADIHQSANKKKIKEKNTETATLWLLFIHGHNGLRVVNGWLLLLLLIAVAVAAAAAAAG